MRNTQFAVMVLGLAAIVMSALMGCGAPDRGGGTSPSAGTTNSGGGPASGGVGEGSGGTGSGGIASSGGATGVGGSTALGGATGSGGSTGRGGTTDSGGAAGSGGATPSGGTTGAGGARGSGGATGVGGSTALGGATGSGGSTGRGGTTDSGGAAGSGGATPSGGTTGAGGTAGSSGTTGGQGPCDIYQAAKTPCVAANSTVRALYASYSGNLYQVRRTSDKSTKDIPVLAPGGFADSSAQEAFCPSGTACTISIIYDQSPQANHLVVSGKATWLANGATEADAAGAKIKVGGHTVYGIHAVGCGTNCFVGGYRNNNAKGLAKNDDPESMYWVVDAKKYNNWCCFDYGNAETNNIDDGSATMETLYYGADTQWETAGGSGPWIGADLENGMWYGEAKNATTNTPISSAWSYLSAFLKGPSGNHFALKAGDAQSGQLVTKWDGSRPGGYSPQKKQGAVLLGTGGDGSPSGEGIFFEGAITSGCPSDATDDAVQANVVAAGYGR